ncbi:response regulator transcription factor [Streptomyces sp. NPDC060198]|uniref:response regulator transcription factor n=1 Tax=Streptomyces sp. NPDC060198 TaxID=3347070 RepID=UPI0036525EDE
MQQLQETLRADFLAVAEERDLQITTADVAVLVQAAVDARAKASAPRDAVRLSAQQVEVLIGLATAEPTDETARRLVVTASTVATHRRRAYRALGAVTSAQAVAIAMSLGLLQPGQRTEKTTAASAEAAVTPDRALRTAVFVGLALALREQPTAARLLDGLDELGEAVIADAPEGEIATWVAALSSLARLDTTSPATKGTH